MLPTSDNKKTFGLLILISAYFLISIQAFANDEHQSDSLKAYIDTALRHNPVVLQRYFEYQAALQKVPQVGSLPDPELTMGIFLTPMELISGKQAADLKLMQMFPWFGVLRNARDEMSMMAKAKFELFRDAKLQLAYDIEKIWFELYKLKRDKTISESSLEILKAIEKVALIRYQAPFATQENSASNPMTSGSPKQASGLESSSGMTGMTDGKSSNEPASGSASSGIMGQGTMSSGQSGPGLSSIYRIKTEAGDLKNNIATLDSRLATLRLKFNLLLNRPVGSDIFVPDTLVSDTLNAVLSPIPDSIPATNPMLGMALYEKQAIDARRKMVTAMGYPMVGIGVDYSVIQTNTMSESKMNGKDMIMPMLSITIPVYRKKYKAARKETEFLSSAAEESYNAAYNSLKAEFAEAMQQYDDAERRIRLNSEQSELAEKSLRLILRSFSVGSADLTDLLRARQLALDYALGISDARADLNIAIARLNRLMANEN
jgi:outer membrane protein TolC